MSGKDYERNGRNGRISKLMEHQLVLPFKFSEPTSFDDIVLDASNAYAIKWLKNWPQNTKSTYSCIVGHQSLLLASIWGSVNQSRYLSNNSRLLEDWYMLMENKYRNRCYILANPEIVNDEKLLLYVLNLIKERHFYLLLASNSHPSAWKNRLPDLKSRLSTINIIKC